MCGIAGKLLFDGDAQVSRAEIKAMLRPIIHRGPDGQRIHLDRNLGLGHNRLSIIDLDTGDQPMANENETIWVVSNGEIYNFKELREQLIDKGHIFRTKSDTEVIVHLYEDYGAECVQRLRGMFAFALWDAMRRRLIIARDRVGIKPLYYCQTDKVLYFASELKAILANISVSREIDLAAIQQFFSFYYVPGERTLFKSIRKLLPGHYLLAENGHVSTRRYWDLQFNRNRWAKSFDECVDELYELLSSTVRDHMIADVPVGMLLSGGVDSSAVLSFAVNGTNKKLKTFTVGFERGVIDERPFAKMVARRFGTEHYEVSITEQDFWDFLPDYIRQMEEPVHEPPAVALYYVSKLARDHVKVLLSGEGGDEAFAGYPNYPNMIRLHRFGATLGTLAEPVGGAVALAGRIFGDERVQRYGHALGRPLTSQYFSRSSGPTEFFNRNAQTFFTVDFLEAVESESSSRFISDLVETVSLEPLLSRMQYIDTKTWLPDDLLIKADKMTMANSLELRVPFLDHQVLEFAASLPPHFKVRGKQTKRILKATVARTLSEEILQRKKAGFPVPYSTWLSNGLRNSVEDVLSSQRSTSRGFFRKNEVTRLLGDNARRGNRSKELFCLLLLELWCREFLDGAPTLSAV
jgi:asparagine synthase (glutamine-hydrolysing)